MNLSLLSNNWWQFCRQQAAKCFRSTCNCWCWSRRRPLLTSIRENSRLTWTERRRTGKRWCSYRSSTRGVSRTFLRRFFERWVPRSSSAIATSLTWVTRSRLPLRVQFIRAKPCFTWYCVYKRIVSAYLYRAVSRTEFLLSIYYREPRSSPANRPRSLQECISAVSGAVSRQGPNLPTHWRLARCISTSASVASESICRRFSTRCAHSAAGASHDARLPATHARAARHLVRARRRACVPAAEPRLQHDAERHAFVASRVPRSEAQDDYECWRVEHSIGWRARHFATR